MLDSEDALAGEILIHAGGTNVTLDWEIGDGDVEAIFAGADLVVSERFYEHRHGATPLETRGLIAEVGDDGRLTVWGPAKVKHFNLTAIASVLGLAPERVRFIEPDVGGAFGARGELYPEDYLIPWAAMSARPAREVDRGPGGVADRPQPLPGADDRPRGRGRRRRPAACLPRPEPLQHGRVHAHEQRRPTDAVRDVAPRPVPLAGLPGVERLGVLTNKTPLGTFRGPARSRRPSRAADARPRRGATSIDPVELRRRNLIPAAELPYVVRFGESEEDVLRFGTGDYHAQLDAVLERPATPARSHRAPRIRTS